MKPTIRVITGDITQQKVDGILAPVNSGGMWFGGIDRAIQRCSGTFHLQLSHQPLQDNQTVVAARGNANTAFKSVVFVVDDLQLPVESVISAGLNRADAERMEAIAIPLIRTGVMLGVVEKDVHAVAAGFARAINNFKPKSIKRITVVLYDQDPSIFNGYFNGE